MIDPIMERKFTSGLNMAKLSTSRRDIWPSREVAAEKFRSSKFYQSWDPRVLENWVQYGLRETPTELYPPEASAEGEQRVTLTTPKQQEVYSFLRPLYRGDSKPRNEVQLIQHT